MVNKYVNHGTSLNRNSVNSGRRRTGWSQDNIDAVHNELIKKPVGVTCRINNLDLPSATFNRIVENIRYLEDYVFTRCFRIAYLTYFSPVIFLDFISNMLYTPNTFGRYVKESVKPSFTISSHLDVRLIRYISLGFVFFDTHCTLEARKRSRPYLQYYII